MAATIANFLIIGAVPGTNPPYHNHVYPADSIEYTFVASALGIGLKMMEEPQTQQHMAQLALAFDDDAQDSRLFNGMVHAVVPWISWYVTRIKHAFLKIYIHEPTTDADVLGFHVRMSWTGSLANFVPRSQSVMLNAGRVRDMLASIDNGDRFRTFQFVFATTIVHEVAGHMLVTFLSNGQADTPNSISVPGYAQGRTIGEAGRWLEMQLFGGTTEFYPNPSMWGDDSQPGIPCQIDANGYAHVIHPDVIKDVCKWDVNKLIIF